jgi:hypothetical protein
VSLGGWIGLAAAGGVSVLLAITVIMLIGYAKGRSGRADAADDRARAAGELELEAKRKLDLAERDKVQLQGNVQSLITALDSAKVEIKRLEGSLANLDKELHDAITTLGADAPTSSILAAIKNAAKGLRDDLDRLRDRVQDVPARQAVPQAGTAPAAGGEGGGESGPLHDGADVRDPRP